METSDKRMVGAAEAEQPLDTEEVRTKQDIMMERGMFTANGHTFKVRPIYLGEEDDYIKELKASPVPIPPQEGEPELTDKQLSHFLITFFSKTRKGSEDTKKNRRKERVYKDYRRYSYNTDTMIVAKWIEKKVTYHGRKVRVYDLERKFGLNKAEIERMFMYLHELSGF